MSLVKQVNMYSDRFNVYTDEVVGCQGKVTFRFQINKEHFKQQEDDKYNYVELALDIDELSEFKQLISLINPSPF